MKTVILGGGIAGLATAYFLNEDSIILEKEEKLGGLCRSFSLNGVVYDIGPHIMFSKYEDILEWHTSLIETKQIKRSNKIFYKGRYIKYPFENELSALDGKERDHCLKTFVDNPYENYEAGNMLQFFLKTFGEGITNLYLRPYNEKIWKIDPSYLDLQMVERIPKPPAQDIIDSAHGKTTEGYTHQLYFHYPKKGGYESLVTAYVDKVKDKAELVYPAVIESLKRVEGKWQVLTDRGRWETDRLVNCMPLHELGRFLEFPPDIESALRGLRYNSLKVVVVQVKKDTLGDNFAVYVPDPEILFHRLSKLNALGESYQLKDGGTTLMMEVTFRPGSELSGWSDDEITNRIIEDLVRLGFIERKDVLDAEVRTIKYEYVVYDLNHRRNADTVLSYLKGIGVRSVGRFAEFEYLNSDQVAWRARELAREFNRERVGVGKEL